MTPQTILSIYVLPHCRGCARARRIAEEIRDRVPDVQVDVVDLSTGTALPASVFSVPTYLLDGVVISLGNPRVNDLIRTIHNHTGGSAPAL